MLDRFLLMLLLAGTAGGCAAPIPWLAEQGVPAAHVPRTPNRCEPAELTFAPTTSTLLGSRASQLWRWTDTQLPGSARVGHSGRLGLMPSSTPGVALHAVVDEARISYVIVQSHAASANSAPPLSRRAIERFMVATTGCATFRLCRARQNLDEVAFLGHTTCSSVRTPVQVVTPRGSRAVVSVAAWLPSFSPRHARSPR